MFQALCKRRNVRIRYERYANSITAAAVLNVNRSSQDDPVVSAYDFVRDDESSQRKERLSQAKKFVSKIILDLPTTSPRAKYLEKRASAIHDLIQAGYSNAEEIFNGCWPNLKPTAEEKSKSESVSPGGLV